MFVFAVYLLQSTTLFLSLFCKFIMKLRAYRNVRY
jgi:hypothetical protein